MTITLPEADESDTYVDVAEKRQNSGANDLLPRIAWLFALCLPGMLFVILGAGIVGAVLLGIGVLGAFIPFERAFGYRLVVLWIDDFKTMLRAGRLGGKEEEEPAIELFVENFLGLAGTIYDKERNADTAYIKVRGNRFQFGSAQERRSVLDRLADTRRHMIAQSMLNINYGSIVGSRPFHAERWAQDVQQNYMYDSVAKAFNGLSYAQVDALLAQTPEEWFDDVQSGRPGASEQCDLAEQELQWRASEETNSSFWRLYYVTVERPDSWKNLGGMEPKEVAETFANSILAEMLGVMEEGLKNAGFLDVEVLKPEEVNNLAYHSWQTLKGQEARNVKEPVYFDPKRGAWPRDNVSVNSDTFRTDNCFHAMLITSGFPSKKIPPNGMDPLLTGNPQYTLVSTNVATKSAKKEILFARQRRARNFNKMRRYGGLVEHEDIVREKDDAERINRIQRSRSKKATSYNVVITISASSMEQLKQRIKEVTTRLRLLEVSYRRVKGRSTVPRAFWTATLGTLP